MNRGGVIFLEAPQPEPGKLLPKHQPVQRKQKNRLPESQQRIILFLNPALERTRQHLYMSSNRLIVQLKIPSTAKLWTGSSVEREMIDLS